MTYWKQLRTRWGAGQKQVRGYWVEEKASMAWDLDIISRNNTGRLKTVWTRHIIQMNVSIISKQFHNGELCSGMRKQGLRDISRTMSRPTHSPWWNPAKTASATCAGSGWLVGWPVSWHSELPTASITEPLWQHHRSLRVEETSSTHEARTVYSLCDIHAGKSRLGLYSHIRAHSMWVRVYRHVIIRHNGHQALVYVQTASTKR